MLYLGVNIDHVATLRQARYREVGPDSPLAEPDPVQAAELAVAAGAHSITAHLREDRRHIQDSDINRLKTEIRAPLNLEMAVTEAMTTLALALKPEEVCLVPESRQEVTTEGGLDVRGQVERVKSASRRLGEGGIYVSLFIDPEPEQIRAASDCGVPCIELHTGAYANALDAEAVKRELQKLRSAAELAHQLGLQVNAGHGLNYRNLTEFLSHTPHLHTLNIGHSIVSRAVTTGLKQAVQEMVALLQETKS